MQNLKNCLIFFLTISLFATSCKKDNDLTPTELLTTESGWKLESFTSNSVDIEDAWVALVFQTLEPAEQTAENEASIRTGVSIDFEDLDDCDKDNVLVFNADGTTTENTGSLKCDSTEADEYVGSWSFNAAETILTIVDVDNLAIAYEVASLNSSKGELQVKFPLKDTLDESGIEQEIKDLTGYQAFIDSDVVLTLTIRAN